MCAIITLVILELLQNLFVVWTTVLIVTFDFNFVISFRQRQLEVSGGDHTYTLAADNYVDDDEVGLR